MLYTAKEQKSGYAKGRRQTVSVIGACNIDISAVSLQPYIPKDSNPSCVSVAYGGVGRNIAHNLCLLGSQVRFLTAFGGDVYASALQADCTALGMDLSFAAVYPEQRSSYYLCIMDENGDLAAGASDMELTARIDIPYLSRHAAVLRTSDAVVFDTNPAEEVLSLLLSTVDVPLFADTVSCGKAEKLRNVLFAPRRIGRLHTLKTNRAEAEVLVGSKLRDDRDLADAAQLLCANGVDRVFITLGQDGVYGTDGTESIRLPTRASAVVNATGAGDAFLAALVFAHGQGKNLKESAQIALRASALTVQSASAVNAELCAERILF